jgi:hypothetical protein
MKIIQYSKDVLLRSKKFFETIIDEPVSESFKFVVPVSLSLKLLLFIFPLILIKSFDPGDFRVMWSFQSMIYSLFSLILSVLIFSFFLHSGFMLAGSKKKFGQTFKVVAYVLTFVTLFSAPIDPIVSVIYFSGLNYFVEFGGLFLVCLWGFVVGVYGLYLVHGMSILRTLLGLVVAIIPIIGIAVLVYLLSLVIIFH